MFKIADAYVEVHSKIDALGFRAAAKAISNMLTFGPILTVLAVGAAKLSGALFGLVGNLGHSTMALAAAIPAAVGLGGAIAVLMLLFKDTAGTPMEKFVNQLKEIKKELTKVAQIAAAPAFNRLGESLKRALPDVVWFVERLAESIGKAADQLSFMMDRTEFMDRFRALTTYAAVGMHILAGAIDTVVDMIVTIGAAAGPVFLRLIKWIEDVLRKWQGWLIIKYNTGELTSMFQRAGDEMARWGQIVGNFTLGIAGLFRAGLKEGDKFSESLLRISERFKSWALKPETTEQVQKILETLNNIDIDKMITIAGAITSIGLAIKGLLLAEGAAKSVAGLALAIRQLEASIAVGGVLVALETFAIVLAVVLAGLALFAGIMFIAYRSNEDFKRSIDEMVKKFNNELRPAIDEIGKWYDEYLRPRILEIANNVLPHMERALDFLIEAWKDNKKEIREFVEYLVNVAVPVLSGIFIFAIYTVTFVLLALMVSIKLLDWTIGGLVGTFLLVRDEAVKVASTLGNSLGRAIESLETEVGKLVGSWSAAWGNLVRAVSGAVDTIIMKVNQLLHFFGLAQAASGNMSKGVGSIGSSGGFSGRFGFAHGGIVGAAAGGLRSGGVMVGEYGPELLNLPAGTRVRSNPDTRALMGGAGSGVTVNLYVAGSIRSDKEIVSLLRDELTNQGLGG